MDRKVAVLLCGYGEVEEYDEFADYNERSFKLLVSKSIKFPDFSIPFLSRRLERAQKKEWHAANHYHSPHNDIFERQRAGIEKELQATYGNDVAVFKAFNFVPPYLPESVLAEIRAQGFDRIVVYPWLVVDSVFTSGLALEQINEAIEPDPSWINDMRYLPSFWGREDFQQRLIGQVEEGIAPLLDRYAPIQIGVMLCLHGCPLESKGFETGVRDSEAIRPPSSRSPVRSSPPPRCRRTHHRRSRPRSLRHHRVNTTTNWTTLRGHRLAPPVVQVAPVLLWALAEPVPRSVRRTTANTARPGCRSRTRSN